MQALTRVRIDRDHARAENEPAGTNGRRLKMSVVSAQIEPGQRCGNHFSHRLNSTAPASKTFPSCDEGDARKSAGVVGVHRKGDGVTARRLSRGPAPHPHPTLLP